jgi:PD-(D/E)XK nuclease superfamily
MTDTQAAAPVAISHSEMATWARCRRKWFVAYFLGFRLADEPATGNSQLGTRVHTALEGMYGYGLDPLVVLAIVYKLAAEQHPGEENQLLAEHELARTMIEGYLEWVATESKDIDLQVVATEADVAVPLYHADWPGQILLRARMDQVAIEISTGFYYFIDHKTGDLDKHETLALNPQFKHYSLVQHMAAGIPLLGEQPPGAPVVMGGMINSLRRVKRTERAKPPFYARDSFRYNPEQLVSAQAKAIQVCGEIMTARHSMGWVYSQGGDIAALVDGFQRQHLYPNEIPHDCKWSCPLAPGMCTMMSDGSSWAESLSRSGRWVQDDPYSYYSRNGIAAIRAQLAGRSGSVASGNQERAT